MVSREEILQALKTCHDPELGIDIVSLGLIYGITIQPQQITVTMTLTTPGCPLVPYFHEEIVKKVRAVSGVTTVSIDLTFDPPWDPSKMSELARQQLTMIR